MIPTAGEKSKKYFGENKKALQKAVMPDMMITETLFHILIILIIYAVRYLAKGIILASIPAKIHKILCEICGYRTAYPGMPCSGKSKGEQLAMAGNRNRQALTPDMILQNYWDDREHFADLFNAVLFEGRQVIHPQTLENEDLFQLPGIILNTDIPRKEARQKAIQYSEQHNTDKNVIMTVAGATGKSININYETFGKGDGHMCTLFEEIAKEGKIEGRAEEIVETGYEFGLCESQIIRRLQDKLNISVQAAQEYFSRYKGQCEYH